MKDTTANNVNNPQNVNKHVEEYCDTQIVISEIESCTTYFHACHGHEVQECFVYKLSRHQIQTLRTNKQKKKRYTTLQIFRTKHLCHSTNNHITRSIIAMTLSTNECNIRLIFTRNLNNRRNSLIIVIQDVTNQISNLIIKTFLHCLRFD